MNSEISFSDRLIPWLMLPGAVIGAAWATVNVFAGGYSLSDIVPDAFFGAIFGGIFSFLASIPVLYVLAATKHFRDSGMSFKELGVSLAMQILKVIAAIAVYLVVTTAFLWLFGGSRFGTAVSYLFYTFVAVCGIYGLFADMRKSRNLNVIDERPSKSRAIIKR